MRYEMFLCGSFLTTLCLDRHVWEECSFCERFKNSQCEGHCAELFFFFFLRNKQNLFNYKDIQPKFQIEKNEDAINQLSQLLNHITPNPILLILDDVWLGSEPFLPENFKFDLPKYKILVTSRTAFPRFEFTYHLKVKTTKWCWCNDSFSSLSIPERGELLYSTRRRYQKGTLSFWDIYIYIYIYKYIYT